MTPPPPAILLTLASTASGTGLPADVTRRGLALSSLAALLGITLLCCAALLVLMNNRRRRRANRPTSPTTPSPDPWTESAKRMVSTDETVDLD